MRQQVDLTAIITMHSEGVLAHKTMRSVFEALEKVKEAGYSFEIILHLDNPTGETEKYVERYKGDPRIRIFKNAFGDTGPSRNFAAKKANGKYVSFLDGDDLASTNWYLEAIKILEGTDEEIIVHPEAILTFGIDQVNVLTLQKGSYDLEKDTLILLGENRWCAVLVARKETLVEHPYMLLGDGYGHEDYIFNIETTSAGVSHKIAKETTLFYRRSDSSRLSLSNNSNATIPYMELFDFQKVKKNESVVEVEVKKSLKNRGYKLYKKIRGNDFLNAFITPIAKMTLRALEYTSPRKAKKKMPKFVYDAWMGMNHIDSQLYPYEYLVKNVSYYSAEDQAMVGEGYCKIAQRVTKKPDYIFIVPWIVRGGADKVLFNYIKAMKENRPDWNFMVISTLEANNRWAKNLPEDVDYIDFGKYAAGLPPEAKDKLFTLMIVQTQCKNLHLINSEYGYEWARKHKELLGAEYNLSVSLFAYEYILGSNMKAVYSYDDPALFEIYDVVKNVFTDNEAIVKYTMEHNGFNESKFKVQYQPIDDELIPVKQDLHEKKKINLLWASRVVPVKLPEVVAEIGRKLGAGVTLHIYGEIGDGVDKNIFDEISNVEYHGVYDGFKALPCEEMDIFLYTALSDGVPNVILEAAAAGLPIIASDDGGVGEFVKNKKTGILIKDKTNADEYVEAIKWAAKNMDEMRKYAESAQRLLEKQHSWKTFVEKVKEDFEI